MACIAAPLVNLVRYKRGIINTWCGKSVNVTSNLRFSRSCPDWGMTTPRRASTLWEYWRANSKNGLVSAGLRFLRLTISENRRKKVKIMFYKKYDTCYSGVVFLDPKEEKVFCFSQLRRIAKGRKNVLLFSGGMENTKQVESRQRFSPWNVYSPDPGTFSV